MNTNLKLGFLLVLFSAANVQANSLDAAVVSAANQNKDVIKVVREVEAENNLVCSNPEIIATSDPDKLHKLFGSDIVAVGSAEITCRTIATPTGEKDHYQESKVAIYVKFSIKSDNSILIGRVSRGDLKTDFFGDDKELVDRDNERILEVLKQRSQK